MSVVFALCQLDKTYVNKFRQMCKYNLVSSERSIKVKDTVCLEYIRGIFPKVFQFRSIL